MGFSGSCIRTFEPRLYFGTGVEVWESYGGDTRMCGVLRALAGTGEDDSEEGLAHAAFVASLRSG